MKYIIQLSCLLFLQGLITDEAGYSCSEVDVPCNVSRGWAAVVKYNADCQYDCTIDDKVCY